MSEGCQNPSKKLLLINGGKNRTEIGCFLLMRNLHKMELQRGYCALCTTNTKVVVPPQASSITSILKTVLAEQINVKEFGSLNPALRVCPLCLQNLLTVKMLSKKLQRSLSPESDGCCLCNEDTHLVLIKDHAYMNFLLAGTRYEDTVDDCLMCLDCIKCLELMRTMKTNIVRKFPQLACSPTVIKNKAVFKSRAIKKGRASDWQSYLRKFKPLSRTKYNLQRFESDYTLLHKICFVKLDDVDLNFLKSTYKEEIEDRRSRRKSSTPKKDYIRRFSPPSRENTPSPPQNFFKIKMKQEKRKGSLAKKKSPKSKRKSVSLIRKSGRDRTPRESFNYLHEEPHRASSRETRRKLEGKNENFGNPEIQRERPRRVRSHETGREHTDEDKKLVVSMSRMPVDEDDDEILLVEERDPLAISDDEGADANVLRTPTKASRKMMPDTNISLSGKKRKSVTFSEEKNKIWRFETGSFKKSSTKSSTKKSSLKKSKQNNDSDDEEKIDYLEHVRNNVDDIFNTLKSTEPARKICEEILSDIISKVVCNSDDDDVIDREDPCSADIEMKSTKSNVNKKKQYSKRKRSGSDDSNSQSKKLRISEFDDETEDKKVNDQEEQMVMNAAESDDEQPTSIVHLKNKVKSRSESDHHSLEDDSKIEEESSVSNVHSEEGTTDDIPQSECDHLNMEKDFGIDNIETASPQQAINIDPDWKSDYESKDRNSHIECEPQESNDKHDTPNNDNEHDSESNNLGDEFRTVDSCEEDYQEISTHAKGAPDETNEKQEVQNRKLINSDFKCNGNSEETSNH